MDQFGRFDSRKGLYHVKRVKICIHLRMTEFDHPVVTEFDHPVLTFCGWQEATAPLLADATFNCPRNNNNKNPVD